MNKFKGYPEKDFESRSCVLFSSCQIRKTPSHWSNAWVKERRPVARQLFTAKQSLKVSLKKKLSEKIESSKLLEVQLQKDTVVLLQIEPSPEIQINLGPHNQIKISPIKESSKKDTGSKQATQPSTNISPGRKPKITFTHYASTVESYSTLNTDLRYVSKMQPSKNVIAHRESTRSVRKSKSDVQKISSQKSQQVSIQINELASLQLQTMDRNLDSWPINIIRLNKGKGLDPKLTESQVDQESDGFSQVLGHFSTSQSPIPGDIPYRFESTLNVWNQLLIQQTK